MSMEIPFFSIIIPTYNSKLTVCNTINSIIEQTFCDFEILIIDGLSTDGTLAEIEKINDERIVIRSEKDKGVYDAMNKGIAISSGKWIYFLGSDDLLASNKILSSTADFLSKSDKMVVYGDVLIRGNCGWAKDGDLYRGETSVAELFNNNICHQAIFYKKELFETELKRFELKYIACADYDMNLYLASKYEFQYISQTIAIFEGGGISSTKPDNNFADDKWINILNYYKGKLIQKEFGLFRKDFLLLFKNSIKRFQFLNAAKAFWILSKFKSQI